MTNPEDAILFSMMIVLVVQIISSFATLIANFLIFKKIGENKWLGLIPFVNDFVLFRTFWNVKSFVIYMIFYAVYNADKICGLIGIKVDTNFIPPWLFIILSIIMIFMIIRLMDYIARGFGKGIGWAFGLALCYPIFGIILAVKYEPLPEITDKIKKVKIE